MLTLLKIEWLKVKNYRTFWILLLITITSIPAFNYVIYDLVTNGFLKIQGKNILGNPFGFPDVWQTVSWNSGFLLLIPAVLIITLTTNEFSYKTHRQNIIDGWGRNQFINVKLVEVLLFSLLLTGVVLATSLGFGYLSGKPEAGTVWKSVRFTGFYFIESLSYSLIAFLISMLIKRAGLAMGIFFIYMIIEEVVVAILRNGYNQKAANFFPEEVADMLIPQPYAQKILSNAHKIKLWEDNLPVYLTIAAVYVFVYCIITNWRFRTTDL